MICIYFYFIGSESTILSRKYSISKTFKGRKSYILGALRSFFKIFLNWKYHRKFHIKPQKNRKIYETTIFNKLILFRRYNSKNIKYRNLKLLSNTYSCNYRRYANSKPFWPYWTINKYLKCMHLFRKTSIQIFFWIIQLKIVIKDLL